MRLVLSLSAVALILVVTQSGVGLSPDSRKYISVSDHLLAGEGARTVVGPRVEQPPAYPCFLSFLRVLGIEALAAARVINALCFGLTVYLIAGLFAGHNGLAASLAFLAAVPLWGGYSVYRMAWSEPLFIVFSTAALVSLDKRPLVAGYCLALACLTRYIGVTFVVASFLWLLSKRRSPRELLSFGLVALVPFLIWLTRNYVVSGTLMGVRAPSPYPLTLNVIRASTQILLLALNPILIANCLLAVWHRRVLLAVSPSSLFLVSYLAFLLATASISRFDPIDSRLMAPAAVPLVVAISGILPPFPACYPNRS